MALSVCCSGCSVSLQAGQGPTASPAAPLQAAPPRPSSGCEWRGFGDLGTGRSQQPEELGGGSASSPVP